jgi:copper chaperone CopZ
MRETRELEFDGMHCQACVKRLRAALARVPEIAVGDVEVGKARVSAEAERWTEIEPKLREAAGEAGFALRS